MRFGTDQQACQPPSLVSKTVEERIDDQIAIVFIESGLLVGFFLPGDSLLFTAGLLSAAEVLPPIWVLLITIPIAAIAGGISEALITTKYGLIVAIPALILHVFLSRMARNVIDQMEKSIIGQKIQKRYVMMVWIMIVMVLLMMVMFLKLLLVVMVFVLLLV